MNMERQTLDNFLKQCTTKPIYKPYLPFMKMARDCFAQNPIITYWTLCYVLETALKNQTKPSDDFRKFLMDIMTCLEKEKKARSPTDSKFADEKEAQKFIEEYGNTILEKAEENEELFEKLDLAYKLYLTASNIFQVYTVFVRDDEENAKRIKFCKWKAVECFKKKKELEENPPANQDDQSAEVSGNKTTDIGGNINEPSSSGQCPYPTGKSEDPSGVCPYPTFGANDFSNGSTNLPAVPPTNIDSIKPPAPACNQPDPKPVPESKDPKDSSSSLSQSLASLQLNESDSKRAELLCESALYAIRANDLLTAVETLKQTLDLLYKRAKK